MKVVSCRGVHLFCGGGEEDVDAGGFEECAVGGEGAGVAGEVFVGAELGGVDEDGGGDDVALRGGADEGEVAGVQGAHGGDEAEVSGVAAVRGVAQVCRISLMVWTYAAFRLDWLRFGFP